MKTKNFYNKFWENGYIIIKNFISKKIDLIYLQINDLLNISLKRKGVNIILKQSLKNIWNLN